MCSALQLVLHVQQGHGVLLSVCLHVSTVLQARSKTRPDRLCVLRVPQALLSHLLVSLHVLRVWPVLSLCLQVKLLAPHVLLVPPLH